MAMRDVLSDDSERRRRRVLLVVGATSLGALVYEVVLTRLLSALHWHHFAALILAIAMLGYGASGTVLSVKEPDRLVDVERRLAVIAGLFGLSLPAATLLVEEIPFNGLALFFEPSELLGLLGIALVLVIPFFLAGTTVGLALTDAKSRGHRVYLADLLGAGAGALFALWLLDRLLPTDATFAIGAFVLFAVAGSLALSSTARDRLVAAGAFVLSLGLVVAGAMWDRPLQVSPYKALAQTLRVKGAVVDVEQPSALGVLTVVENREVPLRHTPGRSLEATTDPPPQLAVFTDGDGLTALTELPAPPEALAFLDETTSASAYALVDRPRVAVLGAGGGLAVLGALAHHAEHVDAVELHRALTELIDARYAERTGQLFADPRVTLRVDEARSFLMRTDARYDVIELSLVDAFSTSGTGVQALAESPLYTVEALGLMLDRLDEQGVLSITRWMSVPPKDTLKLVATAALALEARGIADPGAHLALVRSWNTVTLLVSSVPLDEERARPLVDFARERSFDLEWGPTVTREDTNRIHTLPEPYLFDGTRALVDKDRRDDYLARSKLALDPATLDRPFFFHFFKWSSLDELLAQRAAGVPILFEAGYLALFAALVVVVLAGGALVLAPALYLSRRRARRLSGLSYFALLGLGFMFLEMAFIHALTLFVGHPVYAVSLSLAAFLVFAGLGSGQSARFEAWLSGRGLDPLPSMVVLLVGVAAFVTLFLPALFDAALGLSLGLRFAVAGAAIAPVAFFMGMPFPRGLALVCDDGPGIPLAWAMNGSASVVAPLLATLLAVHLGFSAVMMLGLLSYLGAAALAPRAVSL